MEFCNIGRNQAGLIGKNRQFGSFPHKPQSFDVVRGHWLLDHLDTLIGQKAAYLHGVLWRPGRICVDAKSFARRYAANDPYDLHIALGAELDLENRIVFRFTDASLELVVFSDGDGEARLRRLVGIQTPETVDWNPELLADEIVQRRADCAFR